MAKRIKYTKGEHINGLIYLGDVEPHQYKSGKVRRAKFKCLCGKEFITHIADVKCKRTNSCGCYKIRRIKETQTTHGYWRHPLYSVWANMKNRCSWGKHPDFHRYGGRGIKVCKDWYDNPEEFITWGIFSNYQEGLQLDRIDNDGDYTPDNCRFVNPATNAHNRSTTKLDWNKVNKIRKIYKENPNLSCLDISKNFNVCDETIRSVLKDYSWVER